MMLFSDISDVYIFEKTSENNFCFPNCMESTILNFIRILHYDIKNNKFFDINEGPYSSYLNKFLCNNSSKSDIEEFSRFVNLNFNKIKQIEYVQNHNEIRFELETSLYNFLYIVTSLLNIEIFDSKNDNNINDIEFMKQIFLMKMNSYSKYMIRISSYQKLEEHEFSSIEIINRRNFNTTYTIQLMKGVHANIIKPKEDYISTYG
jgi:hypothetical protein